MQLPFSAVSVDERRLPAPGGPAVRRRPGHPQSRRRVLTIAAGMVLGTGLWILYLYLMVRSTNPWAYVIFGLIGAACGVALVTIPALMWDFVRKQGYQILLRQWTDKSRVLIQAARRDLRESGQPETPPTLNDMAVMDILQGDYPDAVTELERASAAGMGEAANNLLAALTESGRWEQLRAHVERDLRLEDLPEDANLVRLSAHVPDEDILQRLWQLARERRNPLLLNNIGARWMRQGDARAAEEALKLAVSAQPGYAYAHANLAVLAHRQGNMAQAVSHAASAAGLVAEDATIFSNLGSLLALSGDLRNAEKWLERAHKLQPRNPAVLIGMGNTYSLGGRHEEAVRSLHAAQAARRHTNLAQYNLGLHYYRNHNPTEAMTHFSDALKQSPDDPDTLNNIGCVLFKQGRYGDAYEYFERVAQIGGDMGYRRNIIRAELAARHHGEALKLIEASSGNGLEVERGLMYLLRALEIKPETVTHRQMMEFNLNAAAAEFTKAMNQPHHSDEAQFNYGLTQYLRDEHVAAAETFAQALRKGTTHAEMYYLTGMSYVMAGLREREQHEATDDKLPGSVREYFLKARPYLEKAVEVQSVAEASAYDLGLLNYLLGEYPKAIEVLRKIARPDSPPHVLNTLALAQAKHAQDMQLSAQTASLMSDSRKQEVRTHARQLLATAIHYFKQALAIEPLAPMTHANMGLALMLRNQKGDVEAALEHWQLMHQHGDARFRRTYEQFMQVMSPEAARRLRFQDVELSFRRVDVADWVIFPLPALSGFRYMIEDLLDEPEWQLQAHHPLVRKALMYRQKAERVRRRLKRLAI